MKLKIITIFLLVSLLLSNVFVTGSNLSINNKSHKNNFEILNTSPSSFDWRSATVNGENGNWITSLKDQNKCGSCWAFATIAVIESVINIENKNPELDLDLSEQYMLSCATNDLDSCYGCEGADLYTWPKDNFLDWAVDNDVVYESCFPYTGSDSTTCNSNCEKVTDVLSWDYVDGRNNIKNKLIEKGPLFCTIDVYEDFYLYHPSSVYFPTDSITESDHAMAIIGYKDTPNNENYEGYWICKCSSNTYGAGAIRKIAYGVCRIEDHVISIDVASGYTPPFQEADLYCSGSIIFNDVEPGKTVDSSDSFIIKNRGDSGSVLRWDIKSEPNFGRNWNIIDEDGFIYTQFPEIEGGSQKEFWISVYTPTDQEESFSGQIVFKNLEDPTDTDSLTISINTPKNKHRVRNVFNIFFKKNLIFENFLFNRGNTL